MAWFVVVYDARDESMVKVIPTPGIDVGFIRDVWSLSDDDTVVGAGYRITPVEVARMQTHIAETINLNSYIYDLCDEED